MTTFELTPREKCIAGLIVRGLSNHGIAHELDIQLNTVMTMLKTIKLKLRARDRAELITICLRDKLVEEWL